MNHLLKTLTIGLLFTANNVFAQTNRYDWGIEGGPNLSTLRITETKTNSMIYGSAGFIFQYNTKKILSFKTGFSYQRKGTQLLGRFVNNDYYYNNTYYYSVGQSTYSFDYISLPFLVKASFGKKVKFFVNAGPYIGFLLSRTTKWTFGDYEQTERDLRIFKRLDYGVAAESDLPFLLKNPG
ncbi:porin family protein [Fluviicola sp.]|uniref:porin family protein n=1 Tax=Fluviicola sp. TaxID=1917219 RepID=UPI003D28EF4C